MRQGDWLAIFVRHAGFPFTLKIASVVRGRYVIADPMGLASVIDQDIGPNDFGPRLPEAFHQQGVASFEKSGIQLVGGHCAVKVLAYGLGAASVIKMAMGE